MHATNVVDTTDSDPEAPLAPTAYVWLLAAVAALGGLLFGWDWVVIGGARQFYEEWFHLTSAALVGWANSCALLGCLAGALLSGALGDRHGRRKLLIGSALLFAVSSVATGYAPSFRMFILWRIVGGIAIGIASSAAPVYIAEVSPASSRGRLVSLNQFAIVVGILLAQIMNAVIARSETHGDVAAAHLWNVTTGWRWMFAVIALPAALFFVGAIALPETPRWLLARGDLAAARRVLQRIVGNEQAELEAQRISAALSARDNARSTWSELLKPSHRKPLLLAVALAVLQQWTGINILFNYASEVYRNAGFAAGDILLDIVITGSVNLLATLVAMRLVDSIGRRKLMLAGTFSIGVSHLLCALAYRQHWPSLAVLLLTLTAIAAYACTLAPVTWVFMSEIFPMSVRVRGMSLAGSALWIASFLLTFTFPYLRQGVGEAGTFAVYGMICFAGWILVLTSMRETSGVELERIQA